MVAVTEVREISGRHGIAKLPKLVNELTGNLQIGYQFAMGASTLELRHRPYD